MSELAEARALIRSIVNDRFPVAGKQEREMLDAMQMLLDATAKSVSASVGQRSDLDTSPSVYEALSDAVSAAVREEYNDSTVVTNWIVAYECTDMDEQPEPGISFSQAVDYLALPTGSGVGVLGLLGIIEARVHDALAFPGEDDDV